MLKEEDVVMQVRQWVERDLGRYSDSQKIFHSLEDRVQRGRLCLWTSKNRYSISFTPGYLGCIAVSRRWRAGEDWHRGNDLADGPFNEETWLQILKDILSYELELPVQPRSADPRWITTYERGLPTSPASVDEEMVARVINEADQLPPGSRHQTLDHIRRRLNLPPYGATTAS
jgi:hypothetical protein